MGYRVLYSILVVVVVVMMKGLNREEYRFRGSIFRTNSEAGSSSSASASASK